MGAPQAEAGWGRSGPRRLAYRNEGRDGDGDDVERQGVSSGGTEAMRSIGRRGNRVWFGVRGPVNRCGRWRMSMVAVVAVVNRLVHGGVGARRANVGSTHRFASARQGLGQRAAFGVPVTELDTRVNAIPGSRRGQHVSGRNKAVAEQNRQRNGRTHLRTPP
ncbi:MAG: hypothetical protein AAF610_10265 [Pseudomonadota bacterium]